MGTWITFDSTRLKESIKKKLKYQLTATIPKIQRTPTKLLETINNRGDHQ